MLTNLLCSRQVLLKPYQQPILPVHPTGAYCRISNHAYGLVNILKNIFISQKRLNRINHISFRAENHQNTNDNYNNSVYY